MVGILSCGAYIPARRLERAAISAALGTVPGRGSRSVASFDEDTTSLGVEASRSALDAGFVPAAVLFATSRPAYLGKTNATAIHAALQLAPSAAAYDVVGSARSGAGALRLALDTVAADSPSLVVLSDIRVGLPGSADEAGGADAAAAFVVGSGPDVLAECIGRASSTDEFLDRWRLPGEIGDHVWEERFGEGVYLALAEAALTELWQGTDVALGDVDHVVVSGAHERAVRTVRTSVARGARPGNALLHAALGNAGCADLGLALVETLESASPGDVILALSLTDGADAFLFRVTDQITSHRPRRPVSEQVAESIPVDYSSYLTWRGILLREPPRRPEPDRNAAPPSHRAETWKYGFVGSRCEACGRVHLPPGRVCAGCGVTDRMVAVPMADRLGTIATFTVDRLAYSVSPPVVVAVVDFDGGGRIQCEMTDVDAASVAVGDRVAMTFRCLMTAGTVHNYFWKARPVTTGGGEV